MAKLIETSLKGKIVSYYNDGDQVGVIYGAKNVAGEKLYVGINLDGSPLKFSEDDDYDVLASTIQKYYQGLIS